jgi:hypothetical protein
VILLWLMALGVLAAMLAELDAPTFVKGGEHVASDPEGENLPLSKGGDLPLVIIARARARKPRPLTGEARWNLWRWCTGGFAATKAHGARTMPDARRSR